MRLIRPQERFRRGKPLDAPSDGSDQVLERNPESIVIVDNRNERVSGTQNLLLLSRFMFRKPVAYPEINRPGRSVCRDERFEEQAKLNGREISTLL